MIFICWRKNIKMNKGYIAITDNNWANFIKQNKLRDVNFWCKKQSFKAINKNDIFFFLKKNNNEQHYIRNI